MTTFDSDTRNPAAEGAIATTTSGQVRGSVVDGVLAFKSVPYGEPTERDRFGAPRRVSPWAGVKDAQLPRSQAPQMSGVGGLKLFRSWEMNLPESEDCLHLHLWTPSLDNHSKRPVMVWLHGGAFSFGSASKRGYDGSRLAKRGNVVVVNVTHRLNVFGHLYLSELNGDFPNSGNNGILDIVEALRWVRDNIEAFGGDPDNVTIFGVSGGGGKVSTLMAMPSAAGLFHKAIIQSSSTGIGARSAASATEDAEIFLHSVGIRPDDTRAIKSADYEMLRKASGNPDDIRIRGELLWRGFSSIRDWRPVFDGNDLDSRPFYEAASRYSTHVPLLITTCKDESRLQFGDAQVLGEPDSQGPASEWEAIVKRMTSLMRQEAGEIVARFRTLYPEENPQEILCRIYTYWRYRHGAIWIAERQIAANNAARVYMSRFDWETPVDGGRWKAHHSGDIPFIFDTLALSESMVGHATPAMQALAENVGNAWVAFARTGDPNHSGLPHWPQYGLETREVMCFNTQSQVLSDPEREERLYFGQLPPRVSL